MSADVYDDLEPGAEPAWCPPARDRIDEINEAVRAAVAAERERIRHQVIELAAAETLRHNASVAGSDWEARVIAARTISHFTGILLEEIPA